MFLYIHLYFILSCTLHNEIKQKKTSKFAEANQTVVDANNQWKEAYLFKQRLHALTVDFCQTQELMTTPAQKKVNTCSSVTARFGLLDN